MTISYGTNRKLGKSVFSTTLPILATCPETCMHHPNNEATCYAYHGHMLLHQKRFERIKNFDPVKQESELLKQVPNHAMVRLHVAGDFINQTHVEACDKVIKRKSLNAWAYTHNWRKLKTPKNLSLLASVETFKDMVEASKKGYPVARVVSHHRTEKAYTLHDPNANGKESESEFTGIPCPAETKGITCDKCKLCLRGEWLHANKKVILFTPHGVIKNKLKNKLIQIER